MSNRSLLIDGPFVAYYPALAVALGDPARAIIVQTIWFYRDWKTDETTMSIADLADKTGIPQRTVERHIKSLRDAGLLTSRRADRFDATTVWFIDRDAIPDTANVADSDTPERRDVDTAKMADSTLSLEQEEPSSPPPPSPRGLPRLAHKNLSKLDADYDREEWDEAWDRVTAMEQDVTAGMSLVDYLASCRLSKGRYRPHPSRWEQWHIEAERRAAKAVAAASPPPVAQRGMDDLGMTPQFRETLRRAQSWQ